MEIWQSEIKKIGELFLTLTIIILILELLFINLVKIDDFVIVG